MSYTRNLQNARDAVSYVEGKMTLGASNKMDAVLTFGASLLCVAALRSEDFGSADVGGIPSDILKAAAKAEHMGCGNCGEQAALAFVHLAQDLKARPLDYMSRTNADHAFVVIGRQAGSVESDHHTWGDSCVVCDPWDGKAFRAADIPTHAYKGHDFAAESLHRLG